LSPFFSIIIPAKNAAQWLDEALESVKKQDFKYFEVLLVNDGSKDATLTIMEQWKSKLPRVTVLNGEGKGLGHGRNLAAQKSTGKFLAFLDADDVWHPQKLKIIYDAIQKEKSKWIYHTVITGETRQNAKLRKGYALKQVRELTTKGLPITPSAAVIEKQLFLSCGRFEEDTTQVEDLGLWLQLLHKDIFPNFINMPLTFYRVGSGVTHHLKDHLNKVFIAIDQAAQKGWIAPDLALEMKRRKYYEAGRYQHKQGSFSEARAFYKLANGGVFKNLLIILTYLKMKR
jgi:glycosyltransferase involved in cell wall biosynthesis